MTTRLGSLDSLRGLAAASVFLFHLLGTFDGLSPFVLRDGESNDPWLRVIAHTPVSILWSGHEAVLFFFVLSGFVLALPYYTDRSEPYRAYIVRRILRIYVPYLAIGALAVTLIVLLRPTAVPWASESINSAWNHGVSLKMLADYVLMTGLQTNSINSVTWSLVHEMRISFFLPLIALVVRRWHFSVALLAAVLASGLTLVLAPIADRTTTDTGWAATYSALHTLHYAAFFVVGALIARYRPALTRRIGAWSPRAKATLLAAASLVYTIQAYTPVRGSYALSPETVLVDWAAATGAATFILLALSTKRIDNFLRNRSLVWLGSISYSFYLVHLVVLLAVVRLLADHVPLIASVALVPLIAIPFAGVIHRLVELPSISWGRQLAVSLKEPGRKERLGHAASYSPKLS